ncbi:MULTISPECIES: DUF6114 domain-containing protein [unclassified Micromonospora]|uniref:DUF6114 domain-containing protein n=1 Tax=unclassified Micromonospora TaxID=2617518 RepID=UPI001B398CC6|nr:MULTISPECIES: DUF6114 domain-containing protein [unclassified Micromonospora]MBQ1043520.1 hypothetical protein [Micromonospora sp. C72]MBQ1053571.1 hypothetical protein [Micromonospora sp. C32]
MTGGQHTAPAAGVRARWRHWRRARPFTAGLLIALGGAEMLVTLRAPLGVLLHVGPQGLAAYLVPAVLVICGVLLITTPQQRVFYAVLSLVLGLVSWLTSNLGGFLVGMLLALVGGALAFAWTPVKQRAAQAETSATPAATASAATAPGPREPVDSSAPTESLDALLSTEPGPSRDARAERG